MDGIRSKADDSQVGLYYHLNLLPELEAYNRADTVNMSDEEMNKFRHIAGPKQTINDLGFMRGLGFTLGKEKKARKTAAKKADSEEAPAEKKTTAKKTTTTKKTTKTEE